MRREGERHPQEDGNSDGRSASGARRADKHSETLRGRESQSNGPASGAPAISGTYSPHPALVKARIAGTYDVDATIQQNDFGVPPGTKTADVWKFTKCRRAGCRTVHLDRQGGTANAHYKSTLHKVRKGVYKGTEGPYPYSCPTNGNSTFTAANTVRLTKAKNGRATEWKGSEKTKIQNCDLVHFVNYTLVGKLR